MSYISRKAKQARSNSNIPRSVSHKPQQARFKYNISRFISHTAGSSDLAVMQGSGNYRENTC